MTTFKLENKPILQIGVYLIVFVLLCCLSIWKLDSVPFHGDESSWISSSESFEAFISFDFDSPVWQESYWTLTQPPLPRYFIGIGRNIAGIGINDLNNPYDYFLSEEENIALNTIPNDHLLWWSRFPMAILMAASVFLIFLGISRLFGHFIGVLSTGIFLFNPYPFYVLRLALGESSLLFFSLLAILFAYKFMQVEPERKFTFWLWLILMGAACGLAAASKLNGGATVLGAIFVIIFKLRKNDFPIKSPIIRLLLLAGFALFSFAIFVLVNPFLYKAPLQNALSMLMFRSYEIGIQVDTFPAYHISGVWQHITTNILRIFQDNGILHFTGAWFINLVLFLLGIYLIVKQRSPSQNQILIPFLCIAASISIPSLFTPLDYPRYFLFPTIFTQLIICFTMASILVYLGKFIQKKLITTKPNPS